MALVRCITEMGMGVDVHGLDYTLAAKRAVFDAIHHSSLGFARLVGATADDMTVHVLIGVPHPEKVNADAYAQWFYKLNPANAADVGKLLDAAAYAKIAGEA